MTEIAPARETAILIGVATPVQDVDLTRDYLDELAFLVDTAGGIPVKKFIQNLPHADSRTYVGSGKLNEIRSWMEKHPADVAVFDDDIFPPVNWFKNCLDTIQKPEYNGILGGSGILLPAKGYKPHRKVGWNGAHNDTPTEVSLVGHAWFMRQEWAKYLWMEPPVTWDNGEDILLSFAAQKHGGIKTFVPPHPESDKSVWCTDHALSTAASSDSVASYMVNGGHYSERDHCVEECKKRGWRIPPRGN